MANVFLRAVSGTVNGSFRSAAVFVVLLLMSMPALAGGVSLAWDPVANPSLAGYMVHYGSAARNYTTHTDVGNVTTYPVPNLVEGATYHFAVTAYDAAHTESDYSNDVSTTVPYSVPVAQFSASATSGTAPLALNFLNASTGNITANAWSFGDGTTSSVQNPSHVYSSAGTYTVSLTVTGPGGSNIKTNSNYINVVAPLLPVAGISASATSGSVPLTVNFTSTSTGSITSYAWNFGDGTTSSAQNPSHVYSSPGVYTVSLTVIGPGGSNTKSNSNFITVTTPPTGPTCPCSIWSTASTPKVPADPDTKALEVGVKFTADRSGSITGISFYKSSNNTGTHVGSLWTTKGKLLARATFTNETPSGWQRVDFATPVAIKADTVYVASYHTNVGRYANDDHYFATAGVDNGPLHALRDGARGSNGVYTYSATPAFPKSGYLSTNYWVDVVFSPSN